MVAAHKDYTFPQDAGYLPVQVGHATSTISLPIAHDDSGDSISELNRSFCELTGLYWLWKNVEADIYGLSHYRRYFSSASAGELILGRTIVSSSELATLLETYDVILSRPRNYWIESVRKHYCNAHNEADLEALERVLRLRHPEYLPAYERVISRTKVSLFNMFAMRAREFDAYCSWLFDILLNLRSEIRWEQYGPYQGRVFGFLAERLLNVWVEHNVASKRACYLPVVNLEGEDLIAKATGLLKRKFTGVKAA